jgi:hypothetical protein
MAIFLLLLAQAAPPKGVPWKDTIAAGKGDAASRKVPIVLLVHDKSVEDSEQTRQAFEDPKVQAILKNFACIYLSRDFDRNKFELNYIPWVGAQAGAQYFPPLLVFADSKGNLLQEFRTEGKRLLRDDLAELLLKVVAKAAPEKLESVHYELLLLSTRSELFAVIEKSFDPIKEHLSGKATGALQDDLKTIAVAVRVLGVKLDALDDRKAKSASVKRFDEFRKGLEKLNRYKPKEADAFEKTWDEARSAWEAMKKALEGVKE